MDNRLEITSWVGYPHLFYQFNFPEKVKITNRDAYLVLMNVIHNYVKSNDASYKTKVTANDTGFCLSFEWLSLKEEEALIFVADILDFVITKFNPDKYKYPEGIKEIVTNNIEEARKMAATIKEEVFQNNSYSYEVERVNPGF